MSTGVILAIAAAAPVDLAAGALTAVGRQRLSPQPSIHEPTLP